MIDKFSHGFINSVYDFNDFTLNELICKLAQKMDEVITQSNESFNYLDWLKEQGLSDEVIKIMEEWKENGTFNNIINENLFNELNNAINEVNTHLDNRINEVNTQINTKASEDDLIVERKRIDSITQLTQGSTTGDAELIDGRNGIDGTTYSLIGNNIRETSKNIYTFISNVFNFKNPTLTNLLNKNNMTSGKMIDANGGEVTQNGCSYTNDYLFLKAGESITLNFATYFTIVRYSINKTFVANIVVNNENLPYIYTADSDMYLKFNVYNDKKDSAMVIKGKILPSKYINYGERIPYPTDKTFVDYQNIFNILNNNYKTNLLNKNNMTTGKILDANGSETDYATGLYTNDYLLIAKGESIIINFATYLTIVCYDLNKKFKTNKVVADEEVPFIFTADSDMYLRFNVYSKDIDKAMIFKGNKLPDKYISYGKYVNLNESTNNRFKNVLSGNYLFVGDSICYGAGATGGYAKLIADKNPNMTYKNIGVSGATICRRNQGDGGTSILNKVEEEIALNTSYNHVILEGGVNDLWNQNIWTLGTYDEYNRTTSLNEKTICGAFESLIRKCKNKWDNAFIYYLIPHSIDRENTKIGFDTLKSIAKKYNVIAIDLRELSGMDTEINSVKNSYTSNSDGVHPNENGYARFYVNPIINILNNYQH